MYYLPTNYSDFRWNPIKHTCIDVALLVSTPLDRGLCVKHVFILESEITQEGSHLLGE